MPTYAIADIHGQRRMLERALAEIAADAGDARRTVVFTGDYVDRGPDSRGVLDLMMAGPSDPRERWINLCGNHESLMIAAMTGSVEAEETWVLNGGWETYLQYMQADGQTLDAKAIAPHLKWIAALPSRWTDGTRIFVHAGLRPGVDLEEQVEEDMQWIRDEFLDSNYDFGMPVVHGHTVTATNRPQIHPGRVALDTGAYEEGGWLTVAVFEDDPMPTRFISVSHPTPDAPMEVFHEAAEAFDLRPRGQATLTPATLVGRRRRHGPWTPGP